VPTVWPTTASAGRRAHRGVRGAAPAQLLDERAAQLLRLVECCGRPFDQLHEADHDLHAWSEADPLQLAPVAPLQVALRQLQRHGGWATIAPTALPRTFLLRRIPPLRSLSPRRLLLLPVFRQRVQLARIALAQLVPLRFDFGAALHLQHTVHLCPLGGVQLPPADLAALVASVLAAELVLEPITRRDADGNSVEMAQGTEQTVTLSAVVDGAVVNWSERRLLVRSMAVQAAQIRALQQRLAQAEAALADVLAARRGKARPTTPADLDAAVVVILERYQVTGLLDVAIQASAPTRTLRPYRGKPAREETTYTLALTTARLPDAVTAAEAQLGWRVYATNRPSAQLRLAQAVLAYRDEYLIERSLGRLKGAPLALRPVYLSRDDHATGLMRLLTIGLRMLTVLEYAIRQRLADDQARVAGLYAGQPHRPTARPTAEGFWRHSKT